MYCRATVHVVMYMTSVLDTRGGGLLGGEQNGNLKGAKIDTYFDRSCEQTQTCPFAQDSVL